MKTRSRLSKHVVVEVDDDDDVDVDDLWLIVGCGVVVNLKLEFVEIVRLELEFRRLVYS